MRRLWHWIAAALVAGCGGKTTVTTEARSAEQATELRLKAVAEDTTISAEEKERRRKIIERRTKADRSITRDPEQK